MPDWLADPRFLIDCKSCLSDRGALAINTMPETKEDLATVLIQLKVTFERLMLCATLRHYRNVMLFAFVERPLACDLRTLSKKAKRLEREQNVPFRRVLKNLAQTNVLRNRTFFADYPAIGEVD